MILCSLVGSCCKVLLLVVEWNGRLHQIRFPSSDCVPIKWSQLLLSPSWFCSFCSDQIQFILSSCRDPCLLPRPPPLSQARFNYIQTRNAMRKVITPLYLVLAVLVLYCGQAPSLLLLLLGKCEKMIMKTNCHIIDDTLGKGFYELLCFVPFLPELL